MPFSAISTGSFANRSLLVENFRLNVSSSQTSSSSERLVQRQTDPGLSRINQLVSSIKDQLSQSASSGADFADKQVSINRALTEISELLGDQLQLGGADNAVFAGLNADQISDVEVLSLPSNASAQFIGDAPSSSAASQVTVRDANRLQGGGSLEFEIGQRKRSISIKPGASLTSLAKQVNSSGFGISASVFNGELKLSSSSGASFEATVRPEQVTRSSGENRVSSVNSSQIPDVDISELQPGASETLTGTRDSVATAASLTYSGDANGEVNGSVTFDLTGGLGTASLAAIEGESLSAFAGRVNNATSSTGVIAEVSGNQLKFVSSDRGDDALVQVSNVTPEYSTSVEGVNANQFDNVDVLSIDDGDEVVLTGDVTVAADQATLTYQGVGGSVVDTARFTITGNAGSAQYNIVQNESLSDVRDRVNADSDSTGVIASVNGDQLEFSSQDVGSTQIVNVVLDQITQYVDVDGVNASQISGFNVLSSEPRSTNTLNGAVTRAATKAELTYTQPFGLFGNAATFTLTGELGSAEIDVGAFDSQTAIRDSINAVASQTGVSAAVSGNTLTLNSDSVGSDGFIEIDVTSGNFDTDGGDGNGNATGLNALLNINGDSVTASGNSVSYTDALGSYQFDVVQGYVGSLDTITVTTYDGSFDIDGADPDGTAYGVDAEATINGQNFFGTGDEFSISIESADLAFSTHDGFVGEIDPITIRSNAAPFSLAGGDGNGVDHGEDGVATINGTSYRSANDTFQVDTDAGAVQLTFANDFIGQIDDVAISSNTSFRRHTQSSTVYRSVSRNATANINGDSVRQSDGAYIVEQNGVKLAIHFADGFNGSFDPFTVSAGGSSDLSESTSNGTQSTLDDQSIAFARQAIGSLFEIASGGKFSSQNASAVDAYSIAIDALANLSALTGTSTSRGRSLLGVSLDLLA